MKDKSVPEEAMVLFDSEQLDIVILDIRFPDGSGISLLGRLMAQDKPPTVIVFTSFPYPAYRKKCMDMGAYCFLEKSEEFEKIPKIIHEIMKQDGRVSQ
jgi:DNA-binding NarL/FixJ family response regulator